MRSGTWWVRVNYQRQLREQVKSRVMKPPSHLSFLPTTQGLPALIRLPERVWIPGGFVSGRHSYWGRKAHTHACAHKHRHRQARAHLDGWIQTKIKAHFSPWLKISEDLCPFILIKVGFSFPLPSPFHFPSPASLHFPFPAALLPVTSLLLLPQQCRSLSTLFLPFSLSSPRLFPTYFLSLSSPISSRIP